MALIVVACYHAVATKNVYMCIIKTCMSQYTFGNGLVVKIWELHMDIRGLHTLAKLYPKVIFCVDLYHY